MKNKEALDKLKDLESELEKLKNIINQPEDLFNIVTDYSSVCKLLKEEELFENSYYFIKNDKARRRSLANGKIEQIQRLFNGDWLPKFDGNQYNYYPYFTGGNGGLLGFVDSYYRCYYYVDLVAFYKDKKTSNFIGKTFIDIYRELY